MNRSFTFGAYKKFETNIAFILVTFFESIISMLYGIGY